MRGDAKKATKSSGSTICKNIPKKQWETLRRHFFTERTEKSPTAHFVGKYYISNEERQTRQIMQEGIRLAAQPATAVTLLTTKL